MSEPKVVHEWEYPDQDEWRVLDDGTLQHRGHGVRYEPELAWSDVEDSSHVSEHFCEGAAGYGIARLAAEVLTLRDELEFSNGKWKKTETERDALAERVAELEEIRKRFSAATVIELEAELARLRELVAELEDWQSRGSMEFQASWLEEQKTLQAENTRLRSALESVEWGGPLAGGESTCPSCGMSHSAGHGIACVVAQALEVSE